MPKIHVPNYVAQAIEKETAEKNKKLKETDILKQKLKNKLNANQLDLF